MRSYRCQPFDERVDEVGLQQNRVGSGLGDSLVQTRVRIAGECDQAEIRMVLAQPRDRRDAVDERHVQVDDDGVRVELVGRLDCVEAVVHAADNGQLRLMLDERPQGL